MGPLFTKKLYYGLLLFAAVSANAQTSFTADASPANPGRDEYVTLKLTVANGNNVQRIQPPSLDGFTVVSGPNSETEMNSMNGATQRYQSLSYILLPKQRGTVHIGAATALVDGKIYKSNLLTVTVSNKKAKAQPQEPQSLASMLRSSGFDMPETGPEPRYDEYILRKGESIPDKVSKNMQLTLQTDKTSCYIGEPVLATYKLYTRLQSESNLSKNPSFNGFSVVDMTKDDLNSHNKESLNGRPYNVYTIRKAQLYPLQSGPITLETATLDNKVEFLRAANDPGSVISQNVSLSSKPLTITVKPLPDAGKPAGFKGSVGEFRIESSLEKSNFSVDETGELIISIGGKGNMQLLTAPDVPWPANFEAFDIKSTDNTDNSTVPVSGSKTFEIPFSVEQPGDHQIPAIRFSFFDPTAGEYKTVTARAIPFHVSAGTGKKKRPLVSAENKEPESVMNRFLGNRALIIMFLAIIIITGIIVWLRRESTREKLIPGSVTQKEPVLELSGPMPGGNPLSQTEDCMHRNACTEFYPVLNTEMRKFLSRRFSLAENFTAKMLATAMDGAGISNHMILQTQALMQDIEWQLYTPFEQDEKIQHTYAAAQTIIGVLNPPVA